MSALDLARLQFASTSIYHFLFVPLTIGMAFLVALLHTAWYRTGNPEYRRLLRFFGALLLVNVAVGVVTGLVQEFEFGMNWSAYSRFVGDVFGAPLAMEGLAAFFLESTFLGLWVFGWRVLSPRVHLASAWLVSLGTALSAAFIMAANSWMQHPVGYTTNAANGRPELSSISALFTNPVFLWGYTHVLLASLVTGSLVMLAASSWYLRRQEHVELFHRTSKLSLAVLLPAIALTLAVGSHLGIIEDQYQPMKIAAAEAQWTTCQPCSFSVFQVGGGNNDHTPTKIIQIPHLLSFLATGTWDGQVQGMDELNAQYQKTYGPGNYEPNVFIQYWSMRLMAYTGTAVFLLAVWGVWLLWRRRIARARVFLWLATWAAITPIIMNTAGWMLTESGRQPWIVQGLMKTANGVSPSVSTTEVVLSLLAFYGAYIVLGIANVYLMLRFARRGLALEEEPEAVEAAASERVPALTY
ncbi:MAG TPA: cytochrome ubiquinol oxidase subunit I [Actinomycetes bacterium]|nr:cytochrome ubiquinol oxidase subunit I [Actinomycetes bacterium]